MSGVREGGVLERENRCGSVGAEEKSGQLLLWEELRNRLVFAEEGDATKLVIVKLGFWIGQEM